MSSAVAAAEAVHLELHGATAPVHDYHAGRAGAFDAALARLEELRLAGTRVVVTTLLTRSTFRVLHELPPLLQARGVGAWCIDAPDRDRAVPFDRLMPRLALALPFALHALERARRLGVPSFIRGAPLCLLGPWAARSLKAPPRAFGPPCDGCPARPTCPGLDATYLDRFGADEIRPRPAVRLDVADAERALGPATTD